MLYLNLIQKDIARNIFKNIVATEIKSQMHNPLWCKPENTMNPKFIQYMNKAIILISLYTVIAILFIQADFILHISTKSDRFKYISESIFHIIILLISSIVTLYILIKEKYKYYIFLFLIGIGYWVIDYFVTKNLTSSSHNQYVSFPLSLIRLTFLLIIYIYYIYTKIRKPQND